MRANWKGKQEPRYEGLVGLRRSLPGKPARLRGVGVSRLLERRGPASSIHHRVIWGLKGEGATMDQFSDAADSGNVPAAVFLPS